MPSTTIRRLLGDRIKSCRMGCGTSGSSSVNADENVFRGRLMSGLYRFCASRECSPSRFTLSGLLFVCARVQACKYACNTNASRRRDAVLMTTAASAACHRSSLLSPYQSQCRNVPIRHRPLWLNVASNTAQASTVTHSPFSSSPSVLIFCLTFLRCPTIVRDTAHQLSWQASHSLDDMQRPVWDFLWITGTVPVGCGSVRALRHHSSAAITYSGSVPRTLGAIQRVTLRWRRVLHPPLQHPRQQQVHAQITTLVVTSIKLPYRLCPLRWLCLLRLLILLRLLRLPHAHDHCVDHLCEYEYHC